MNRGKLVLNGVVALSLIILASLIANSVEFTGNITNTSGIGLPNIGIKVFNSTFTNTTLTSATGFFNFTLADSLYYLVINERNITHNHNYSAIFIFNEIQDNRINLTGGDANINFTITKLNLTITTNTTSYKSGNAVSVTVNITNNDVPTLSSWDVGVELRDLNYNIIALGNGTNNTNIAPGATFINYNLTIPANNTQQNLIIEAFVSNEIFNMSIAGFAEEEAEAELPILIDFKNEVNLSGSVLSLGLGVANINVTLYNSTFKNSTSTNSAGSFSIPVSAGLYNLEVNERLQNQHNSTLTSIFVEGASFVNLTTDSTLIFNLTMLNLSIATNATVYTNGVPFEVTVTAVNSDSSNLTSWNSSLQVMTASDVVVALGTGPQSANLAQGANSLIYNVTLPLNNTESMLDISSSISETKAKSGIIGFSKEEAENEFQIDIFFSSGVFNLTGYVLTHSGAGIASIPIQVKGVNNSGMANASTNGTGYYQFLNLQSGTYEIEYNDNDLLWAPNFTSVIIEKNAGNYFLLNENTELNATLTKISIKETINTSIYINNIPFSIDVNVTNNDGINISSLTAFAHVGFMNGSTGVILNSGAPKTFSIFAGNTSTLNFNVTIPATNTRASLDIDFGANTTYNFSTPKVARLAEEIADREITIDTAVENCNSITNQSTCQSEPSCVWQQSACFIFFEPTCSISGSNVTIDGYVLNNSAVLNTSVPGENNFVVAIGSPCNFYKAETDASGYYNINISAGRYAMFIHEFDPFEFNFSTDEIFGGNYTEIETEEFNLIKLEESKTVNATIWKIDVNLLFDTGLVSPGQTLSIPLNITNNDVLNLTNWSVSIELERFEGNDPTTGEPIFFELEFVEQQGFSLIPGNSTTVTLNITIPSDAFGGIDLIAGVEKYDAFLDTTNGTHNVLAFKGDRRFLFVDSVASSSSFSNVVLNGTIINAQSELLNDNFVCIGSEASHSCFEANSNFAYSLLPGTYGAFVGRDANESHIFNFLELFEDGFLGLTSNTTANFTLFNNTDIEVVVKNGRTYQPAANITQTSKSVEDVNNTKAVTNKDVEFDRLKQFFPGDVIDIGVEIINNNGVALTNWTLVAALESGFENALNSSTEDVSIGVGATLLRNISLAIPANATITFGNLKVALSKKGKYVKLQKESNNLITAKQGAAAYFGIDILSDTFAPFIQIYGPIGPTNDSTPLLNVSFLNSFNFSEETITGNNSWFTIDGINLTNITATGTGAVLDIFNLTEGEHRIDVYAKDNTSNTGRATSFFFIDSSAPEIRLIYPSQNNTQLTLNDTIFFEVFDPSISVVNWSDTDNHNTSALDGFGFYEIPTQNLSVNGTHNITITALDRFGRSSTIGLIVIVNDSNEVYSSSASSYFDSIDSQINTIITNFSSFTDKTKLDIVGSLDFIGELNKTLSEVTALKAKIGVTATTSDEINALKANITRLLNSTPSGFDILEEIPNINVTINAADKNITITKAASGLAEVSTVVNISVQTITQKFLSGAQVNTSVISNKVDNGTTSFNFSITSPNINATAVSQGALKLITVKNTTGDIIIGSLDKNIIKASAGSLNLCNSGLASCSGTAMNFTLLSLGNITSFNLSVVQADPIVKWSFSGSAAATTTTTTTTTTSSSSSSGGAGGGVSAPSASTNVAVSGDGTTVMLSVGKLVSFSVAGEDHTLTLTKLKETSADITVQSDPITFTLIVGGTKYIDFDKDKNNDLRVTLDEIIGAKAKITIKELAQPKKAAEEASEETESAKKTAEEGDEEGAGEQAVKAAVKSKLTGLIIAAVVLVAVVLGFVGFKIASRRKR